MKKEQLEQIRNQLIVLRDECLGPSFDPDGAIILSHTIRWLHFKIHGESYEPTTD